MEKITFVNDNEPYLDETNLNQLQTNIENAINDNFYYKSGDTYTIIRYYGGGFITTGRTQILFSIPLNKNMDNVTPTITGGLVTVRDVSGSYLKTDDPITNANITYQKQGNLLSISLTYSSAMTTTNNTPIGINLANLTIRFN